MQLSFFNPAKLISPTLLNPFTLRCKKVGFLPLLALSMAAFSSLSAQEATAVAEPPAAERLKAMETPLNEELTALDKYVATPDSTYKWDIVNTITDEGGTLFVVDMKSQTWLKPEEVNRTVWQHWLMIYRPKEVTSNRAMMFISGGGNGGEAPKNLDMRVAMIAKATKTVVAELKQVPNQPLIFHGDGQPRVEDDLIAYTWNHYIKTGDERWPARLPMVKSAVRAMDTVSAVMASQQAGGLKVNEFVVAGGSKRGWTTWMTAAVDKRVIGIAPIVIDVLNVDKSMQHHYSAYGFWAPAIDDYVHHKIMDQRHEERYIELLKIEDPFAYRDRFTMPKCIINATGDQFFCPDSSQFYFDQLPGEKHLCYVPNSEHSLKDTDALDTLIAFHYAVVHNIPRPKVEWSVEKDGITVRSETKPSKVTLWQAHNSEARDFRVDTIGRAYKPEILKENGNGIYEVKLTTPKEGWNASFIQCEYDIGGPVPLRLTTPVKVLPETLPAAP